MNLNDLILNGVIARMENLERPITTGRELSKTYSDLFDKLEENGYLHDGERELLMRKLILTLVGMMEGGQ